MNSIEIYMMTKDASLASTILGGVKGFGRKALAAPGKILANRGNALADAARKANRQIISAGGPSNATMRRIADFATKNPKLSGAGVLASNVGTLGGLGYGGYRLLGYGGKKPESQEQTA